MRLRQPLKKKMINCWLERIGEKNPSTMKCGPDFQSSKFHKNWRKKRSFTQKIVVEQFDKMSIFDRTSFSFQ